MYFRPTSLLLLPIAVCACTTEPASTPTPKTVEQRWGDSNSTPNAVFAPVPPEVGDVVITVNGHPIPRARLVDTLMESHGVAVTEQLIALQTAKQAADEKGIIVSPSDVEAEYRRALDAMLGETAAGDPDALRTKAAETLLDQMLASRNISRTEYMIVLERNAILRKIVEPEIQLPAEAIQLEFDRLHGRRVQIRHIQTASQADFQQVLKERSQGAEFGDLALRFSANRPSAERLGLLPPFPADDPDIPEPIRREAFLLPPGQDSSPIYVDGWYHLIRVEQLIDAEPVTLDEVRPQVESSLRERLVDAAMRDRYATLFQSASIEILDPIIKELFDERHPDQGTFE